AEPFDIALRWDFPPPRGATVVVDLGLTWEIQSERGSLIENLARTRRIRQPPYREPVCARSVSAYSPGRRQWVPIGPVGKEGDVRIEDMHEFLVPGMEIRLRILPTDQPEWLEIVQAANVIVNSPWLQQLSRFRLLEVSVPSVRVLPPGTGGEAGK
ncbi:MAG: hypothetical protein L0216_03060, partial [Planctomycetales bacterium]|nr:hypothetical protein [Planctomycetales bacterium]